MMLFNHRRDLIARFSTAVVAAGLFLLGGCAASTGARATAPALDATQTGVAAETSNPRLRVIGTNDFHGHLRPSIPLWSEGREVGGAAALAAYFAAARDEVDAPTILLDAGDALQGAPISNLTLGRATIDFYNAVGYTAAAIGNHEFDWTAHVFRERIAESEFPWLAANIYVEGTDTLPSWVRATSTERLPGCAAGPPACDSVQVGIIGIITRTTPTVAAPSHVAAFDFGDEAAAIDRWVPRLRDEGADFVIVVAHEGAYCDVDPTTPCRGPMVDVAHRVQHPPDLIVSGHTHSLIDIRPAGIPITQSRSFGSNFTVVDLERVSLDSVAVVVRQPVAYVDAITPDSSIAGIIAAYEREMAATLYEVVTEIEEPLHRSLPEYPLGNLIADAQRAATGTQVAIMNNGGIRTEVRAGVVRYDDLVRVQPFGNTLVTMRLTGDQLLEAIEHALGWGRTGAHVSGITVEYRPEAEVGSRLVRAILGSGETVVTGGQYTVTANNFLAEGGDGFSMLAEGSDYDFTGIDDLQALIEYLRSLPRPLPFPRVGRFTPIE